MKAIRDICLISMIIALCMGALFVAYRAGEMHGACRVLREMRPGVWLKECGK